MNKTLTAVAVVLLTVTALFAMADYGESDGDTTYVQGTTVRHLTTDFYVITDCGSVTYTNASVPSEYIFIAHCNVKANAFKDCTKIKEVIFDKSVGSVGDYAFAGCTNLNSMSGTYLTKIGAHAFEGTCIFYLSVGPNLTSIGDYAFKDCRSLQKIPTYNTSLTSIGNGVFYGCTGLRLMDMRGLTYTSPTAFQGTNIQRQILDVGQTYCLPDIPKIWIEDGSMYRNAPWGNATTYYVDSEVNSRITLFDMEGNEVENDISYESYATINRFTLEAEKDYISGTYYRTVHFPEGLGLDDMPAKSGESFALPTVELGDISATTWVIAGITGEVDSINAWSMRTMGDDIYPLPVFNTTEAVLVHTDLPSIIDISGLATSLTYTFGDAYPKLPDVDGYEHTGWRVGSEVLGSTAMISEFSAHTAYSLWTPTAYHTLSYTQKDGTVISTEQQGNGRDITVSDVRPDEEDGEIFTGWSLEGVDSPVSAGYRINMLDDVTLTPVFDDRAVRQVSFISESVVIRTYDVYDGRTFTVELDDPERDWFDFLYWKSGSTILTKGDSTTVTGDMEFNAYWKTVKKVSVTYHVGDDTTVRDHRADTPVIIFLDPGDEEGMVFSGWSKSRTSESIAYRNGDSVDLTSNLALYAVWTEAPEIPPAEQPSERPDDPQEPAEPETPAEPTAPETPTTPETPAEPAVPGEPSGPQDPVVPETPVDPTDPTTPETPSEPAVPGEPSEPETPVDPVGPQTPESPAGPETPVDPTDPTTPETPSEPAVPGEPSEPETPVDPVGPQTPESPAGPETPSSDDPLSPGTSNEVPGVPQSPSGTGGTMGTSSIDTSTVAICMATVIGSVMAGLVAMQMRRT